MVFNHVFQGLEGIFRADAVDIGVFALIVLNDQTLDAGLVDKIGDVLILVSSDEAFFVFFYFEFECLQVALTRSFLNII